jgi:peroxiredoxin Q/BCP
VCSLRDAATELDGLKARVVALSLDDVASQKAFVTAEKLSFPLLCDPDGSATAKFGALMTGKPYANRVTFLVDPKGVVRAIDRSVKVDSHGQDIVAALKKLQGEDK